MPSAATISSGNGVEPTNAMILPETSACAASVLASVEIANVETLPNWVASPPPEPLMAVTTPLFSDRNRLSSRHSAQVGRASLRTLSRLLRRRVLRTASTRRQSRGSTFLFFSIQSAAAAAR